MQPTAESSGFRAHLTRWEIAFLIFVVASGFVLRLWGLSKVHYWDENVYLQNANAICCGKSNYTELDSRPPLISLLFAGVFLVWHHVYAAAIVTALLNALGAAWLYLAGRMFAARRAAAIAALLLGFAPFFVGVFYDDAGALVPNHAGHSLLADAPAVSLLALSLWLLFRALAKQTDLRFGIAGFALALSVLMRFGSLSSALILGVLTLLAQRKLRAATMCLIGFFAGFGPYLCWSRWRYGGFLATIHNGWLNFGGANESPFFYLKQYGSIFTWISLPGLLLWAMHWGRTMKPLQANGNTSEVSRQAWKIQAVLLLWILVVVVFFSTLKHSEPRYIMPMAPPLFLLAGIGLSRLLKEPKLGPGRVTSWAGPAILAAAMIYTFLPLRLRVKNSFLDHSVSEEMIVSEFLNQAALPAGTSLYANSNYPDFGYYTNLQIEPLSETAPEVYKELGDLSEGDLLIAYKTNDDGSAAVPEIKQIDADPRFERLKEFPSLIVYQYKASAKTEQEKE